VQDAEEKVVNIGTAILSQEKKPSKSGKNGKKNKNNLKKTGISPFFLLKQLDLIILSPERKGTVNRIIIVLSTHALI
jgi:hypothetical protein